MYRMKKAILLSFFIFIGFTSLLAQSVKTDLSLKISAAAAANRAQLASYVWTRTVQVFIGGVLKNTIVSSLSIGPDGKMVTTAVSSTPTDPPPTKGIRGDIARKKIGEMKTYVDNAVLVSASYIYMNKGNMLNYVDAAAISQSGNIITINGSNVLHTGDQLTMILAQTSLKYVSENFKSVVSNGDAIAGTVNYKTFDNGLTAINNAEFDLPAKNMKLMVSNSNYAKKLQ
jgi:hypothetical protein